MAIQNPPITDNPSVDFTLLELVKLINTLEEKNNKLIKDIRESANFAELKTKVNQT